MDDSISDDINIVSSDDDEEGEGQSEEDTEPELIDDEEDDDDDVEMVGAERAGHTSPDNDEVVVVDENAVTVVDESDEQETSEDDMRGEEEEEEEATEEDEETRPAPSSSSAPVPRSQTETQVPIPPEHNPASPSAQPQISVPAENSTSSPHSRDTVQSGTSSHSRDIAQPGTSLSSQSTSRDIVQPGTSSRENVLPGAASPHSLSSSLPGASNSPNPNTSLDDFQTPVSRRPLVLPGPTAVRSNDSVVEFRSPKRRRVLSPVKSCNQGGASKDDEQSAIKDEDDGNCCSICFESWDNSGRHRLSSLKCGHLFGLGCIEKWLKGQGGKCPTCNEKAKIKDIRVIYAKAIKMTDTTERDRALQELEREREMRRKAELEAAQARLQCQQCVQESRQLLEEVERLRGEVSAFRSHKGGGVPNVQSSRTQPSQSQQLQGQFVHDRTIKIWEGGQCRVMAHCNSMAVLVISQPSANMLFPGFGIKKLSCLDYKTSSYLTLHQKPIRGIAFHQTLDDGILLSASMDKTVKLTSVITNTVVQTYKVTMPVWSCEWNADSQHGFFVGQQNGVVLEFDTRNTGGPVRELNTEGSKSPVVALQYMSRDLNAAFRPGGLIVGQLDRVSFYESKGDNDSRLHILPLEGNLTSLNIDARTRHLLASFRPTAKYPTVRHQLCELTSTTTLGATAVSCNVVHTFQGGRSQSVLSKTSLLSHPADQSRLMVVAGDEPSESTLLWDTGTNVLRQRLACQGVPVDFSPFTHNNTTYLAALTDKTLKLHRWQ